MAVKFQLKSDGSVSGTQLIVDGTNITEAENVTNISMHVHGGIIFNDGDQYPARVSFSYDTIEEDEEGAMTRKSYSYDPTGGFRAVEGPIGKPEQTEDSIDDGYVGKEWQIVKDIKELAPDRDNAILESRSKDSLTDTLADLKAESEKDIEKEPEA